MRSAVPASITPAVTSSCRSRCEIGMAAPNMRWCGSGDRTGSPLHTSFPSVVLHAEPEVHNGVPDAGDHNGRAVLQVADIRHAIVDFGLSVQRSEEHASELQSREKLVCRL